MPRQTKSPIMLLALSPAGVATALGIRPDEVADAIRAGLLPVYVQGIKRRVLCSDVEAWVKTCANTSHDEPAPTRARKRIQLLPFRALFHPPLSRSDGFRILRSIFGHREFSVLFCRREIRKPRKRSTLGRSNLGWQTAQIGPSLDPR
jgi:hypothetical protein